MGQQASKQLLPLTFGYVNDNDTPPPLPPKDIKSILQDYVSRHPQLYKLELTCQCTLAPTNEEWIVSTQQQECRTCRQNKRMSFVRRHIAKDLEYIDETYYSGSNLITPTATTTTEMDDDLINENWAKMTVGEATLQIIEGNGFTSFGTKTSFMLDLADRSLVKLSAGIGYLGNLTKLNLSNNQLSSLPTSIGYLQNLSVFNASNNKIDSIPDTIIYLTKLKAINISHNKITQLPNMPLGLVIIIANNNRIRQIPKELAKLQQLVTLNISHNPIRHLPAQLVTINSLRKLETDGCDFCTEFITDLPHNPPSLFEQCARTIVRRQLDVGSLSDPIRAYLSTHQSCSYCHGPYFESFVTRGRFIRRDQQSIALEYTLCCAHWRDEQDRLLHLFSTRDTDELSATTRVSVSYSQSPTLPPLPSVDSCSSSASIKRTKSSITSRFTRFVSSTCTDVSRSSTVGNSMFDEALSLHQKSDDLSTLSPSETNNITVQAG